MKRTYKPFSAAVLIVTLAGCSSADEVVVHQESSQETPEATADQSVVTASTVATTSPTGEAPAIEIELSKGIREMDYSTIPGAVHSWDEFIAEAKTRTTEVQSFEVAAEVVKDRLSLPPADFIGEVDYVGAGAEPAAGVIVLHRHSSGVESLTILTDSITGFANAAAGSPAEVRKAYENLANSLADKREGEYTNAQKVEVGHFVGTAADLPVLIITTNVTVQYEFLAGNELVLVTVPKESDRTAADAMVAELASLVIPGAPRFSGV